MQQARRWMAVIAVALLVVSSGCVGLLTDGELAFESSPGNVSDTALDESGYTLVNQSDMTAQHNFTVREENKTVRVTNWMASYEKSANIPMVAGNQTVAQAYVITTPAVRIAGHTLNPVADLSNSELVEFVFNQTKSRYPNASDIDIKHVSDSNVTLFGEQEKMSKFHATVEQNGQDVGVYLHVTSVDHDGDYVIILGTYPAGLAETEEDALRTFIGGVQHG